MIIKVASIQCHLVGGVSTIKKLSSTVFLQYLKNRCSDFSKMVSRFIFKLKHRIGNELGCALQAQGQYNTYCDASVAIHNTVP